jgi:hypothetical protein
VSSRVNLIRLLFVVWLLSFGVRLGRGVTICLGTQETKVLVRSWWWLEDGGGLPPRRVIYTERYASVVPMGTWPMGDSEGLWVVRIPSHSTVCLIVSPLDQGCSLIHIFWLVIKTHKRVTLSDHARRTGKSWWTIPQNLVRKIVPLK